MLYSWREAKHWISEAQPSKPVGPEDPRYEEQLEREMEEAFRRSAERHDDDWETLHADKDREYVPFDDGDDPLISDLG